jgi:hypothetical protein
MTTFHLDGQPAKLSQCVNALTMRWYTGREALVILESAPLCQEVRDELLDYGIEVCLTS